MMKLSFANIVGELIIEGWITDVEENESIPDFHRNLTLEDSLSAFLCPEISE